MLLAIAIDCQIRWTRSFGIPSLLVMVVLGLSSSLFAGGPYKVLIEDLTGDQISDLIVSYEGSDRLDVLKGTSSGAFEPLSSYKIPASGTTTIQPIFNFSLGDVDQDGLVDIFVGIGGPADSKVVNSYRGRGVLLKNLGQGNFDRRAEFHTESQAKGVKLADLDRDGRLDAIYTSRGSGYAGDTVLGKLTVRKNYGSWVFGAPVDFDTGRSAYYVETGDLNRDGWIDVVVPNEHDGNLYYYLNPGLGLFTGGAGFQQRTLYVTQLVGAPSAHVNDVRVVDFNNDGHQDIVTVNLGPSTLSLFYSDGKGEFRQKLLNGGKDCTFLSVVDLNVDNFMDLVVSHWTEDFVSVFLNDRSNGFKQRTDFRTALGSYGIDSSDLNGDGHPDIVSANYRDGSLSFLHGTGDGLFSLPQNLYLTPTPSFFAAPRR